MRSYYVYYVWFEVSCIFMPIWDPLFLNETWEFGIGALSTLFTVMMHTLIGKMVDKLTQCHITKYLVGLTLALRGLKDHKKSFHRT